MADKSAYAILNVAKGASEQEIKRAYVELVKRFDPEKHTDRFMVIQRAYERLRDPRTRAKEDVFTFNPISGRFAFTDDERLNGAAAAKVEEDTSALRRQVRQNPDDEASRQRLAGLLMKDSWVKVAKKAWKEAIQDWEDLIRIDPSHHRAKNTLTYALSQLGYSYALHGLFEEAAANWERSLKMNPDQFEVIHNLALAYDKAEEGEKALRYWAEVMKRWKRDLERNPDDQYVRECLIELHKFHGDQALEHAEEPGRAAGRAKEEYTEALKIRPDDFEASYHLALTMMSEKNFKGAIERLQELHKKHPKNTEVLNLLGWAYLNGNNHDRAFKVWRQSLSIDPDNSETKQNIVKARMQLAHSLREKGQFTYALVHYKELQRLLPGSEEVQMEIARTFQMRGDRRSAEVEFRRVLEMNPSSKDARKALSELRMGR